ncbi:MAG: hypothetical protein AB8G11_18000 [Saprospiraceae bacterium]
MKFFRSIRKKLLSDNKFTKYITYAFGEIILVVIGILIALNINIRNEEKQNKVIINNALREIQHNLLTDIEQARDDATMYF